MTGLLLGILLARTFAGWVSKIHGWRYVFVVAAVLNLAFVPLLWRVMPKLPPRQNLRYTEAMRSLWTLLRTQPLLRESCVLGALVFASFSCFWTTLAFLLDRHYGLGAGVAGTFGVVGAAGALVAPVAGRLADQHGSRWVVSVGLLLLAGSYLLLWGAESARISMAAASRRAGHRRHRPRHRRADDPGRQPDPHLRPGSPPRAAASTPSTWSSTSPAPRIGSALSTIAWVHWRWNGVCLLALGFIALAGLRHAAGRSRSDLRQKTADSDEMVGA